MTWPILFIHPSRYWQKCSNLKCFNYCPISGQWLVFTYSVTCVWWSPVTRGYWCPVTLLRLVAADALWLTCDLCMLMAHASLSGSCLRVRQTPPGTLNAHRSVRILDFIPLMNFTTGTPGKGEHQHLPIGTNNENLIQIWKSLKWCVTFWIVLKKTESIFCYLSILSDLMRAGKLTLR